MESEMRTGQSNMRTGYTGCPRNIIIFKTILFLIFILLKNIQLTKWNTRCDTHRDKKWVTLWKMSLKIIHSGRFLNPHPVRISVYKCIIIKVLFLLVILYFKEYTTNKMESEMRTGHFHPYNIIIFNTILFLIFILLKNIQLTKWNPRCARCTSIRIT